MGRFLTLFLTVYGFLHVYLIWHVWRAFPQSKRAQVGICAWCLFQIALPFIARKFDIVFLAGVEAHLIPHARSVEEDPANLEEERRLFYVAIPRAKKRLYMTSCRMRKSMRGQIECQPSPFLAEIPGNLIENHVPLKEISPEEASGYFSAMKRKVGKT